MPMVQGSLYISEEQILWFSFPIMISRHQCIWILSCFVFVGGFTLLHLDFDLILFWVAVQLIIRKLKKSVCSQAESRPLKASTQRSTSSFGLLSFVMQLQHLDVKSGERICLWECLFSLSITVLKECHVKGVSLASGISVLTSTTENHFKIFHFSTLPSVLRP